MLNEVKVIIVNSFDTFEYRVMLLRKVLENQGAEVLIVGSDYRHIEKTRRTSEDPGLQLLHAYPYKKNISVARLYSHMKFAREAFDYIKDMDADVLYLVVPPNSQTTIAKKYAKKHPKAKIVMDLIDLWPESFPSKRTEQFPFTLWGALRNKNLKAADLILTECNLYREKLKPYLTGKKVETLYWAHEDAGRSVPVVQNEDERNVPLAQNENERNVPLAQKWCLGYLGSVNNIIDMDKIAEVIRFYKQDRPVELHVVGAGESLEELKNTAENAGAKVIYHGKIYDYQEKKTIFDQCHFGLNLMKDTVVVGLSMKSIDYMEMGLPIINSLQGDSHSFVKNCHMGYNIEEMQHKYDDSMRQNARKFYDENCSYQCFEQKVQTIFTELTKN